MKKLLITMSVIFALLSLNAFAACTGVPYPGTAQWTVNADTFCKDMDISWNTTVQGTGIAIINGSNLYLQNVSLLLTSGSWQTEMTISVAALSGLYINDTAGDGSTINAGANQYKISGPYLSVIDIRNSLLEKCGNKTEWPSGCINTNGTLILNGNTFNSGFKGIWIKQASVATIVNNYFADGNRIIQVDGNYAPNVINISNNRILSSIGEAIRIEQTQDAVVSGNNITNTSQPISVYWSDGAKVQNNVINGTENGITGIKLMYNTTNSIISGNNISNIKAGTYGCIAVYGGEHNILTSNILKTCSLFGIAFVVSGGVPVNNFAYRNTIDDDLTTYCIISSGTGVSNTVVDSSFNCLTGEFYMIDTYGGPGTVVYSINNTNPTGNTIDSGTLYTQWHLNVFVNDSINQPIQNANVYDLSANGTISEFTLFTDASGYIRANATQFTTTDGNVITGYNNHSIVVQKPGYASTSAYPMLTANLFLPLTLTGSGVVPEFSSYIVMALTLMAVLSGIVAIRKKR